MNEGIDFDFGDNQVEEEPYKQIKHLHGDIGELNGNV